MDVLADLLERSRAHGAVFAHSTVHGRWGLGFPARSGLAVHAMLSGEASLWLGDAGAPPGRLATADADAALAMAPGDVVLVRGDLPHAMGWAPGAACVPLDTFVDRAAVAGSSRRFALPGDGDPAVFLCGAYRFVGDLCSSLLASLPPVVHVRPQAGGRLHGALDLLARELDAEGPGQQTVLDRLLDIVLVGVLREHLGRDRPAAPSWLAALYDPQVATALGLLHADPARGWTVASLAAEVGLSRSAFARRFSSAVGEAPLEYATRWRMALARERLREGGAGLAAIAREVGYSSEFAFAAAFKRHHGVAPGRWRVSAGQSSDRRRARSA